ncbi:MAG: Flp pilus assembly protein CpaB [Methylococcus sp.]|nr:MAG: Flp pilus assembly protein CpaB [Methylococcus sp.]
MLNSRTLILLAIALVLALAAVFVAQRWLSSKQEAPVATVIETVPVVVAAAQIDPLDKIKPDQLKVMELPKSSVPFDASLPGGGLNFFGKPDEVVGKFATQAIFPNELIVRQRLRDNQGGSSLSNILAPSMRAVSVRVNEATGVAGFLLSGNHVDILNTRKAPDSDAIVTQLVLQNVKILAVDQDASTDDKGKPTLAKTVTVEVRPQEASKLMRAAEVGTIQIVLRNPGDDLLVPESAYASRDELPRASPTPAIATAGLEQANTLAAALAASSGPAASAPASTPPPKPAPPPRKPGQIRTLIKKDGKMETLECFKSGCIPLSPENQQNIMGNGFGQLGQAVEGSVQNLGVEMEGGDGQ